MSGPSVIPQKNLSAGLIVLEQHLAFLHVQYEVG